MALQNTDLFVVQSQTDKQLYSLKVSDLSVFIEGGSGIQFRGSVELADSALAQTPPVTLSEVKNGDLYIVLSTTSAINADWIMEPGVTTATENDRIIWDEANSNWIKVSVGTDTGGIVTEITATTPLVIDNSTAAEPVLSIKEARTTQANTDAGDGAGTAGYVKRLADSDDVDSTNDSPPADITEAVVTADMLRETNIIVDALSIAAGGVTTVSTEDENNNGALTINPVSGNVKVEINTANGLDYGVVQIASAQDIIDGTAGASAVVDASQLQAALGNLPSNAVRVTITATDGQTVFDTSPAELVSGTEFVYLNGTLLAAGTDYDVTDTSEVTIAEAAVVGDVVEVISGGDITGQRVYQNLGYRTDPANGTVTITDGDNAIIPAATKTEAGLLTAADKDKLDDIEVEAQVNVQSDWNETEPTDDAFILNKPNIVSSITEGGTDIVNGALQINIDGNNDVNIGVNEETFAPYDFSTLTDINA